jgi:hypothetical protein
MNHPRWLSDTADGGRRALRAALDEAPPFAPSDVRRRRVWAGLMHGGARRWAPRRAFVAGAMLASLLTAAGFLSAGRIARWRRAPVAASPVQPPPAVVSPSPPAPSPPVDPHQRAVRTIAAGVSAEVAPSSWLVLDAGARPEVRGGTVLFDVAAQEPERRFVVGVARYRVIVAGARFSVALTPGAVRVEVQTGTVEVWGRGQLARVPAGGSWKHTLGASPARVPSATTLSPPAEGPPAAPSRATDAEDLAAARRARVEDPARAIVLYERIFGRGGAAAESALYEIGGIYHDQLRDPERALAAWERYRARFPHGQLRAETDLSIVDTLARLGQRSRAFDEALAFLRRHPDSERRAEVARVAADLARARGQHRLAATLYAEVAKAHPSADDADDAAFGRAWCLDALRDPDATAAVEAYLLAHPQGRHAPEARQLAGARK